MTPVPLDAALGFVVGYRLHPNVEVLQGHQHVDDCEDERKSSTSTRWLNS